MLRSEAEVVKSLEGCLTIEQIYSACAEAADTVRERGHEPVGPGHGDDRVWKRRARSALQDLRRQGRAERVGRGTWLVNSRPQRATVFLLIGPDASLRQVELRIEQACELLGSLEALDLVLCDPPYGLARDQRDPNQVHHYRRNERQVLGGYVEVGGDHYLGFSREWISQAAQALRPGGQLAVITGPQRAAHVQIAAEEAGLDWVSSIAARRCFPLYHRRRPAPAHWTITVMCQGTLYHPERVFNAPPEQRARSGRLYPLDWWEQNGRSDRPQALRYDNALPEPLCRRLVRAFSDPGQLVCDPFLGSGSVMLACLAEGRGFIGSDLNPAAVRFAAARLLAEEPALIC